MPIRRRLTLCGMLAATALTAASCQTQPGTTAQTGTAGANGQVEANKAAYRRMNDIGFGQGDTTVVDSLVAETMVEHETTPGIPPSREGLKQLIVQFRQGFPDGKFEIQQITGDGDLVWVHSTMTGTNTGPFMGQKPTGKAVHVEDFDLVRFENGKAVEHWGLADNLAMMTQLGMAPGGAEGAAPKRK